MYMPLEVAALRLVWMRDPVHLWQLRVLFPFFGNAPKVFCRSQEYGRFQFR